MLFKSKRKQLINKFKSEQIQLLKKHLPETKNLDIKTFILDVTYDHSTFKVRGEVTIICNDGSVKTIEGYSPLLISELDKSSISYITQSELI